MMNARSKVFSDNKRSWKSRTPEISSEIRRTETLPSKNPKMIQKFMEATHQPLPKYQPQKITGIGWVPKRTVDPIPKKSGGDAGPRATHGVADLGRVLLLLPGTWPNPKAPKPLGTLQTPSLEKKTETETKII
jgi:hypothetical protein